jgi:uncharacterized membrane protein (Fun14 family)
MSDPSKQSPSRFNGATLASVAIAASTVVQGADPEAAIDAVPDAGSFFNEALFLRLGFSFIVGLAAGFALKIAFKVALVVMGVMLVGIFALQYAGLAEVDWTNVGLQYDSGADWVGSQGGALLDFMGSNLPSAASFVAGLALGLKL